MPSPDTDNTPAVLERRAKVAALMCRGLTQVQILRALNMDVKKNRTTISHDMAAIRRNWQNDARVAFDEMRAEQLAALRQLRTEAWEEWRRSCLPAETTTTETRPIIDEQGVAGEPLVMKEVHKVEGKCGDAALANAVLKIIVEEEELMGVKARPGEQTTAPPVTQFRILVPGVCKKDNDVESQESA